MNHFAVHLRLTEHCKSTIHQYKIKIKQKRIYLVVKLCGILSVLLKSEGMFRQPTHPVLLVGKEVLITLPGRMLSNKCILPLDGIAKINL